MTLSYNWSQNSLTTLLSGSNPDRDVEHRYLYRTLWDQAIINTVAFEWHNGAQTVKIRLNNYVLPDRKQTLYQTGDWIWIAGFGEYQITDTDYNKNIWIDADYNELAAVTSGTAVFRTRSWRVTEPGTTRFGYAMTTASVETNAAMSTYLQADWFPTTTSTVQSSSLSHLRYYAISGSESVMRWTFQDNAFSGSVAFVSTDTSAPVFEIGDQVVIQQQQTGWNYDDNTYVDGRLAFTGSTAAPFPANSTIYVTGQDIQSAYNGTTSVYATSSGLLVTNKTWLTDTATDAGTIYGYARPEYNRTATIINSFVSASMRWVVTDIPWAGDSVAIGGQMLSATNTRKTTWSSIDTASIYQIQRGQSDFNAADFVMTGYNGVTGNHFSSIIATGSQSSLIDSETYRHKVQTTDSGYLLAIPSTDYDGTDLGIRVVTYNSDFASITQAEGLVQGYSNNPEQAFAFPYGLKDLEKALGVSLIADNVAYYQIYPYSDQDGDIFQHPVAFEVTRECVGLDAYCVMWRDSMGSITSFPFQYVAQAATEIERAFWNPYVDTTATLTTTSRDKWRLNSAFISNADEDRVIRDLLGANEVWLKLNDEIIAINITTSEYNYGNRKWGDLPNVTLDVVRAEQHVRI